MIESVCAVAGAIYGGMIGVEAQHPAAVMMAIPVCAGFGYLVGLAISGTIRYVQRIRR